MNVAVRSTELIPATPAMVWEVLTDWSTAPRWMGAVSLVQPMEGDGHASGALLRVEARGKTVESRVDAWEPERLVSLASRQGGVTARYDYRLERFGDGTRIALEARCLTEGLLWVALSPIIRLAMRRTDRRQLPALRQLMTEVRS